MSFLRTVHRRWPRVVVPAVVLMLVALCMSSTPATAASFVRLGGDGSSWAGPAIDQWSRDVQNQGITVDYSPDGSAAGRQNFIVNQADFAGSDVQFLTSPDPFGGGAESAGALAYSYIPIVAGGTAFMYNLLVGGRKITNLRLSGLTLAKIFTGKIKNWNDPAITTDYGSQLPSQPITVVTRSDGSGASYQFSRYLYRTYPSVWASLCSAQHISGPCGPTEFYPNFPGSQQKNGSDQVADYVANPTFGEGSIAYDEYSYANSRGLPVVKLLNAAGYYTQPTASNVAIALQAAQINNDINSTDFLIQNLDHVYGYGDPRTYPVSSYSYLIVPRDSRPNTNGPPPRFTTDKGKTLSTWLNYVLCGAQQTAGQLGYSPLPKNLVVGGFEQVLHIPGHVGIPNLNNLNGCHNPTYSDGVNHLITGAPQPSPCDKVGSPLNCTVQNGRAVLVGSTNTNTGNSSQNTNTKTGNSNSNSSGGGQQQVSSGTTSRPTVGKRAVAAAPSTNPITGESVDGAGTAAGNEIYAAPVALTGGGGGSVLFSIVTALELLGAVLMPAVLGIWLRRRRGAIL